MPATEAPRKGGATYAVRERGTVNLCFCNRIAMADRLRALADQVEIGQATDLRVEWIDSDESAGFVVTEGWGGSA